MDERVIEQALEEIMKYYRSQGIGEELGFGSRPAALIVDFQKGLTDPEQPAGADMDREVKNTAQLLKAFRFNGFPVIFTVIAYHPTLKDGGLMVKKTPVLGNYLLNSSLSEVDSRLQPQDSEPVLTKQYGSSFFGTPLASMLTAQGVDTLVIAGCITSGCIRATAVDALQYGFRAVIPRECVADRSFIPHQVSLMDLQARYADVRSLEEVLAYIENGAGA